MTPAEPAFNAAANLCRWADGPRLSACFSELVEGLAFDTTGDGEASLQAIVKGKKGLLGVTLVSLKAPGLDVLRQQMDLVNAYADLRTDRLAEIQAQMGFPVAFWAGVVGLQEHRHPATLQLLSLVFSLANHVEMRFKHQFAVLRPVELSPQIQPMLPTPGHGAFPSGHATEAHAAAQLLLTLLQTARPGKAHRAGLEALSVQLRRLAHRIAVNRTVAGLHYPVDSACGRVLGTLLAEYLVARCTGGALRARRFDGSRYRDADGGVKDFDLRDDTDKGVAGQRGTEAHPLPAGALMAWLWDQALREWA